MDDALWIRGSLLLIGLSIGLAGLAGVLLPSGRRSASVFSLVAGAGVGIVVLAVSVDPLGDGEAFWRTFFWGSVLGCATVTGCLGVAVRASRGAPQASRLSAA